MWEKEDGDEPVNAQGKQKKEKSGTGLVTKTVEEMMDEFGDKKYEDRYRMDPLLVRREATLILLCLKAFRKRVIVFVNEKKQCGRLSTLFAFFGLKSVEVHGDLSQE